MTGGDDRWSLRYWVSIEGRRCIGRPALLSAERTGQTIYLPRIPRNTFSALHKHYSAIQLNETSVGVIQLSLIARFLFSVPSIFLFHNMLIIQPLS
jgi:hypothetical protein